MRWIRWLKRPKSLQRKIRKKRAAIDTKNQAESVVYQTEKQLKELGDKVPPPVKEKVETKLKELKDAISVGSTQTIKDAMASLNQEVMQLGQSLYSQPGPPGSGPAPDGNAAGPSGSTGSAGDGDGDVIDADFSESK